MAALSNEMLRASIAEILQGADLSVLSSKKVRQLLEEKHSIDLSDRKKEVDAMILSMINQSTDGGARSQANGTSDQSESDSDNDEESDDEYSPKKKKFKGGMQQSPPQQQQPTQQQQAPPPMGMQTMSMQPPSMSMPPMQMGMGMHPMGMQPMGMHQPMHQPMHPHQGMHPGMQPMMMKHYTDPSWNYLQPNYQDDKSKMMPMMPTPAPPPAPSAPATTKGSRKGTSTYSKKCILSPELAEVMGATEMARHEVVKKMWQIVKERNLADPKNKQFAVCDDQLLKIFGVKRFRTFGMMKFLKHHIKDPPR